MSPQALQREREDMRRQLAQCSPQEYEHLREQLLAARRAAGELPIAQEQSARHKQLWQEAEARLAELQVGGALHVLVLSCKGGMLQGSR